MKSPVRLGFEVSLIFFFILIIALLFTMSVMSLIRMEFKLDIGDGIYVLGLAVFLIASIPPTMMALLIQKWMRR